MVSGAGSVPVRSAARSRRARKAVTGYSYLMPSLIFLASFTVYPVFQSMFLSFSHWELLRPPTFVGLWNYQRLLQDERFW